MSRRNGKEKYVLDGNGASRCCSGRHLPCGFRAARLHERQARARGGTGIFEGDNGTGYVVTAEKTGYGGAVVVTVGFDTEGKILSVKANVSTETQGVGSKVGEASMLEKFEGLSGDVSGVTLKTGATFTSNAVRDGVQAACAAIAAIQ